MRVLMFTQYYPPEVGATQNRMAHFAQALVRQGHAVTVVTALPNHPAGVIQEGYRGRLWMRRVEEGVAVIRVWVATTPQKTFITRLAFYLSYVWHALLAGLLLTGSRHDVVFATSPPLTVGLPGLLYARLRRVPFVLDVRDLWPILAVELGEMRSPLVVRLAHRLERLLYRGAAAVTVVTRGFRTYIHEQGLPDHRVVFLPNGTVPEVFRPLPPDESLRGSLGLDGRFVVGFFGNHGIAQDLEGVLKTAHLMAGDARVRFLFVGEGPVKADLMGQQQQLGLTNVSFLGQVSQAEVIRYISLSDVMVVPLRRIELFRTFIPSKLFDFMACAQPILLQVDGEAREILEQAGAGVFVPPGDPSALAAAIWRMMAMSVQERTAMGAAGRDFVRRYYLRDAQGVRLEAVLQALASGRAVPEAILATPAVAHQNSADLVPTKSAL
jgi:glycosyltransferase involved in cell wall biosynthesis